MTDKHFKLSKTSKRILATLTTAQRGHWKGMMIQAEEAERLAKLAKLKDNKQTKGEVA